MKARVSCEDKYECKKLASLIFIKESKETYITKILNIIENEVIVALKDKSAHSILLKDKFQVEIFATEPYVVDPVDLTFDAYGNVYVVEMLDYPYKPQKGKGTPLSACQSPGQRPGTCDHAGPAPYR